MHETITPHAHQKMRKDLLQIRTEIRSHFSESRRLKTHHAETGRFLSKEESEDHFLAGYEMFRYIYRPRMHDFATAVVKKYASLSPRGAMRMQAHHKTR